MRIQKISQSGNRHSHHSISAQEEWVLARSLRTRSGSSSNGDDRDLILTVVISKDQVDLNRVCALYKMSILFEIKQTGSLKGHISVADLNK